MDLRNTNIDRCKTKPSMPRWSGGHQWRGFRGRPRPGGARVGLIDADCGLYQPAVLNLVWGGIKYMEGYEFGLVADSAARERIAAQFSVDGAGNSLPDDDQSTVPLSSLGDSGQHLAYWLLGRPDPRPARCRYRIRQIEELINSDISIGSIEYSDAFLHDNDARFVFNFVRGAMTAVARRPTMSNQ